ncbi:hypothetical protein GCM10009844_22300 [Nocardioides koreensis]|uniref:Uncharacterized protein n=1 Tax=Nocardioides koreensis TaxID=433651 RepID=A0ABN2ZRG8_9ACTN
MQHQAVETEEDRPQECLSAVPRHLLRHLACAIVPRLVLIGALLGITGGISPAQLAHAVAGGSTSAGTGCASGHGPSHQARSCR